MCLIGLVACEEPKDKQIIAANLLNKGSVDTSLLVGKWDCIKFAYTTDGNKIKDVANISNCTINFYHIGEDLLEYNFSVHFKVCMYPYSRSGNIINYIQDKMACYAILEPYTDEELEVAKSLVNAYSFVIKGNELIIHFIGIKNKNLLILKKPEL